MAAEADGENAIRINGTLYDLTSLRDPPIVFWELLEKRGLLTDGGELRVVGLSNGFNFLHYALCSTQGVDAIENMIEGGDPPLPRSIVTSIRTSELQGVMDQIAGILGADGGDATTVRPFNGKSSKRRTSSRERTGGRSAMSES